MHCIFCKARAIRTETRMDSPADAVRATFCSRFSIALIASVAWIDVSIASMIVGPQNHRSRTGSCMISIRPLNEPYVLLRSEATFMARIFPCAYYHQSFIPPGPLSKWEARHGAPQASYKGRKPCTRHIYFLATVYCLPFAVSYSRNNVSGGGVRSW